jgi:TolB-like protein/Tfp pilus assembly protein PilF
VALGYLPVFRAREASPPPAPAGWRGARPLAAAGAVALAAVFLLWTPAPSAAPPLTAVAVLPFQSFGTEDYVADGVVDEITGALSRAPGLRVVARTSASRFRGARDLRAAGREMHAGAVVEGGVHWAPGGLRISAQLIGVADGYHLWSGSQTVPREQTPRAAEALASSIASALMGRPGGAASRAPAVSADPKALDLYWRGRYLRRQRGADSLRDSARLFEQAVARDPRFAAAWASLAEAYTTMSFHQVAGQPPEEMIAKARTALDKAMEADSTVAEAHAARAFIRFFYDWDWNGADRDFRRALTLNPSYAKAHRWYSLLLQARNRIPEALRESQAASDLDPLAYVVSVDHGVVLYSARRYDEAIQFTRRTLAIDPSYTPAHALLGLCLSAQRQYPQAIAELETAARGSERYSYLLGRMGHAYARWGKRQEAEKLIAELEKSPNPAAVSLVHVAYIYAGLGENNRAIDLLERACPRRDADACFTGVEPLFDTLRSEPRFTALLTRYGLPQP